MASIQAFDQSNISQVVNNNLLPNFMTFNKNVDYTGWNIVSGSGIGANDIQNKYIGDRSLYLFTTDDDNDFEANSGGIQTRVTASKTGFYFISFQILNPALGVTSGDLYTLKIAKNGVGNWTSIYVDASQMNGITEKWVGFQQQIYLTAGDYIDFSHLLPANNNYPISGNHVVYVDGFKLELDDRSQGFCSVYSEPYNNLPPLEEVGDYLLSNTLGFTSLKKILQQTQTLDFQSTLAGEYSDLTMTITGAVDGNIVELGVKSNVKALGGFFDCWVSIVNVVTIRFYNNTLSTINLPSQQYIINIKQ